MNCRKVANLLSAYIDGELAGVESLQIRDHLGYCHECALEYSELLGMKRLVGRLKIQEPGHESVGRVIQCIRVDAEQRSERSPMARLKRVGAGLQTAAPWRRALALGAVAAAVVAVSYSRSLNANHDTLQIVGVWDRGVPPASVFTTGANYPDADRFVQRVTPAAHDNGPIEAVSFSPERPLFYRMPSSSTSDSAYTIPAQ